MSNKNTKIAILVIFFMAATAIFAKIFLFSNTNREDIVQRPLVKKIQIVATTTMIADALTNIVKDKADVQAMMKSGVDPHAYKPTHQDVSNLDSADIVFYNGLHLEGKMAEILENSAAIGKNFFAVTAGIERNKLIFDESFAEAGIDPHVWFDISLWIECVQYMCNTLSKIDPNNATFYQKNTAAYIEELKILHKNVLEIFDSIPTKQKVVISAHDAFCYFGRAYGVKVMGLQGISTISECGIKDISDMVSYIIHNNVKAIFLETSVPEGPIRSVVEGCKKRGYDLQIGGYLYSDSLGSENSPEATYIGVVKYNTETIKKAIT